MTKGTPSFGRHNKRSHVLCRRCGKRSYHIRKLACSACGYGSSSKIRKYSWQQKTMDGVRTR